MAADHLHAAGALQRGAHHEHHGDGQRRLRGEDARGLLKAQHAERRQRGERGQGGELRRRRAAHKGEQHARQERQHDDQLEIQTIPPFARFSRHPSLSTLRLGGRRLYASRKPSARIRSRIASAAASGSVVAESTRIAGSSGGS